MKKLKFATFSIIRASVDALCRDGADHVSRDPCTNSPVSRPRSINWA